jgi:hypothetical protein
MKIGYKIEGIPLFLKLNGGLHHAEVVAKVG